jgi:prophage regulatory protein
MAKLKRISIAEAKAMTRDWEIEWDRSCRADAVDTHFQHASAADVISMWEKQLNEKGRPLTQFEFEALATRWFLLFGAYPANRDEELNGSAAPQEPEPPPPEDDTMLHLPDVERMTGLSESTIERYYEAGKFPKPTKISARRIGWPAHKVKAWVAEREGYAQREQAK